MARDNESWLVRFLNNEIFETVTIPVGFVTEVCSPVAIYLCPEYISILPYTMIAGGSVFILGAGKVAVSLLVRKTTKENE